MVAKTEIGRLEAKPTRGRPLLLSPAPRRPRNPIAELGAAPLPSLCSSKPPWQQNLQVHEQGSTAASHAWRLVSGQIWPWLLAGTLQQTEKARSGALFLLKLQHLQLREQEGASLVVEAGASALQQSQQ